MAHHELDGSGHHRRVLDALGARIVSGGWAPGFPLDPLRLESEYGVSRSVIREVLRSLGSRGLVRARSGTGTFIADRRAWNLLDPAVLRWQYECRQDWTFLAQLTELRLTIEPTAARLAATRRTHDDIAVLSDALDGMASEGSASTHVDADIRFHRELLFAAHNELFENMFGVIEFGLRARDLLVHDVLELERGDDLDGIVRAHRQVFRAVEAGRPRAAELAMRRLLDQSASDIERVQHVGQANPPGG